MSHAIGKYLLSVASSAMLLSLSQAMLPKGAVRQIAGFIGGLLVILTVLSPVVSIDPDELSRYVSAFSVDMETDGITDNSQILSDIIKQRCESYILDKAKELGANLEVSIVLCEDTHYPYPVSVILKGQVTPEQKMSITEMICLDMGIAPQQQEWETR